MSSFPRDAHYQASPGGIICEGQPMLEASPPYPAPPSLFFLTFKKLSPSRCPGNPLPLLPHPLFFPVSQHAPPSNALERPRGLSLSRLFYGGLLFFSFAYIPLREVSPRDPPPSKPIPPFTTTTPFFYGLLLSLSSGDLSATLFRHRILAPISRLCEPKRDRPTPPPDFLAIIRSTQL